MGENLQENLEICQREPSWAVSSSWDRDENDKLDEVQPQETQQGYDVWKT